MWIICGIIGVFFAREYKLFVTNVFRNKTKLLILGVVFAAVYIGSMLYVILTADELVYELILNMLLPAFIVWCMYHFTSGSKEQYEIEKKVNKIPEVKRANVIMVIYAVCYFLFPGAATLLYIRITGEKSFHIPSDKVLLFLLGVIIYFVVFFLGLIFFSRHYRKYRKIEMAITTQDKTN
jgi:hypothetical protein